MTNRKTSYLGLIFYQYRQSFLNQLALILVVVLFCIAIFAPVISNSKPLLLKINNQKTYPALSDMFFINRYFQYPQYQGKDLKTMSLGNGDKRIMPPVPYSPTEYDLDDQLIPPGAKHLLGTDEQGRDILSRMIHGSRVSLSVGFVAVGICVLLGLIVGAVAGYYAGKVDMIISRIMEIVMCFPTFFLILAVLAFVGPSLLNIMIIIGITGWTGIARLVRGEFFKLRNQDFVTSIIAAGARAPRIIFKHILPNAMGPVMVAATFGMASAVLIESSLSYLGFGVQPPTPSWGDILSQSHDFMDIAWWLTVFPGAAIFITILVFNLVGEGLRDAIDPKLRRS